MPRILIWLISVTLAVMNAAGTNAKTNQSEVIFWESVRDSKNAAEIKAYLDAHRDSAFSALARFTLKGGATGEQTDDAAQTLAQKSARENVQKSARENKKDKEGNQEEGEEPRFLDFPEFTGHIIDEANLLSENEKRNLAANLEAFEDKTTHRVVIVTLPSLQGRGIEDYAHQLGNYWGLSAEKKDDYVILVVAQSERKVRIEVGRGASETLTNRHWRDVVDNKILPRFREGNYAAGIKDGADAILFALASDSSGPEAGQPVTERGGATLVQNQDKGDQPKTGEPKLSCPPSLSNNRRLCPKSGLSKSEVGGWFSCWYWRGTSQAHMTNQCGSYAQPELNVRWLYSPSTKYQQYYCKQNKRNVSPPVAKGQEPIFVIPNWEIYSATKMVAATVYFTRQDEQSLVDIANEWIRQVEPYALPCHPGSQPGPGSSNCQWHSKGEIRKYICQVY